MSFPKIEEIVDFLSESSDEVAESSLDDAVEAFELVDITELPKVLKHSLDCSGEEDVHVKVKRIQRRLELSMKSLCEKRCQSYAYIASIITMTLHSFIIDTMQFARCLQKKDIQSLIRNFKSHLGLLRIKSSEEMKQDYTIDLARYCSDCKEHTERMLQFTMDHLPGKGGNYEIIYMQENMPLREQRWKTDLKPLITSVQKLNFEHRMGGM